MKKLMLLIIFCVFAKLLNAQGIKFNSGIKWQEIQNKASHDKKFIFLDTYTTWCVPCKKMTIMTFSDKAVGDFFNENFISAKIQIDQNKDDDEIIKSLYDDSKSFNENYKITAFPTVFYFAPDGRMLKKSEGFKSPNELLNEAKHIIGLSLKFDSLAALYKKGARDSSLMKNYSMLAREFSLTSLANKVAQEYISNLKSDEFLNRSDLDFIKFYTVRSSDPGFKLFLGHEKEIDKFLGAGQSGDMLYSVLFGEKISILRESNTNPNYTQIASEMKMQYGEIGERAASAALAGYAWEKDDVANFVKYKNITYEKWNNDISDFVVNNDAWWVFERTANSAYLESALRWQSKLITNRINRDDPGKLDTYANILYRLGRIAEAIKFEKKAIELDRIHSNERKRSPDKVYANTLEKMKLKVPTWPDKSN